LLKILPFSSTTFLAYFKRVSFFILTLLFSHNILALNQCELSVQLKDVTPFSQVILQDQPFDLTLPAGAIELQVSCVSNSPSVFSFRRNDLQFTWQDIQGQSTGLNHNHVAYLIPVGVYQGLIKINAHHDFDPQIQLFSYGQFVSASQQQNLSMGIFYGLCLVLALYVLIIGRNLGDVRFKLYSLYIGCAGLYFLLQEGQLNLFLSDTALINNWQIQSILAGLTVFTAVLFISRLLDMHLRWKTLTRYFLMWPAVTVMIMPFILLVHQGNLVLMAIDMAMAILTLFIVTLVFCLVGYAIYLRVHTAKLIFIALLLVLIAMIVRVLLTDLSPFLYRYGLILSFAVESFMFAIATSERIKRINQNRIVAEEEAVSDELCDVMNRRGWSNNAAKLLKWHTDQGGYLCLLYIDLDRFKQVNDLHGHQVGDEVLKVTAKIIRNGAREADVVGRLGGDEFVALAHFIKKEECETMINRITHRLTNYEVRTSVGEIINNASVGSKIFETPPSNVNEMLKEGDSAMYQEKQEFQGAQPVFVN
jgi:diguanylate cyclase